MSASAVTLGAHIVIGKLVEHASAESVERRMGQREAVTIELLGGEYRQNLRQLMGEVSEIELRRAFTAFVHGGAAGSAAGCSWATRLLVPSAVAPL